jgi:hypothetical protein
MVAWKYADQLRVNGGDGIPRDFFKKRSTPTARESARRELEKKLLRLQLPRHYAVKILRQGLRPVALRNLLQRLVDLRLKLEQATSELAVVRSELRQALNGPETPSP